VALAVAIPCWKLRGPVRVKRRNADLLAVGRPSKVSRTEAHVKQIFLKLHLNANPDSHRRVLAYLR
jgi:hypothetical protein